MINPEHKWSLHHSFSKGACVLALCTVALGGGCTDLPSGPADTSGMMVKGITLVDWTTDGYGSPSGLDAVVDVSTTGANTATFIVTVYQSHPRANQIRVDPAKTPRKESIADAVVRAKSLSFPLAVTIKPHIDLDDGSWRGTIVPDDPAAWFASYKAFILEWASWAEGMNIDQFIVGTELAGTLENESHWRSLINDVRGVFSGELTYAASWDEAGMVPFWPALDVVGVNFYAPVSGRLETGRVDILAAWQPWLDRLRLLHKQTDRDILITEIGYRSVDGAGMHPYDWHRSAPVDLDEQADLYWGALEALGDRPWVRGVYWWNWPVQEGGFDPNTDYTPAGKPAERELIDAWGR